MTLEKKRRIPLKRKLRIEFLKWHRRIGVVLFLFVLLVAVSGMFINHSPDLGLDTSPLKYGWMQSLYGVEPNVSGQGFSVGEHWVSQQEGAIFWDRSKISVCDGQLLGVTHLNDIAVLCQDRLIILDSDGQLVETIKPLPYDFLNIGHNDNQFMFSADVSGKPATYVLDEDSLLWLVVSNETNYLYSWSAEEALPKELTLFFTEHYVVETLTWERALLDLHSGRIFGTFAIWFWDGLALLLMFLAASGLWLRMSR